MEPKEKLVEIYQLHIWLKHSSPMVWRRLLVRSDTTIADLHHYIQIVMGWEDEHLHEFTIGQGSYGISHPGGMFFDQDPEQVMLKDFDFYINEKFKYEYNFYIPWEHEIRLEKKLPFELKKKYPSCIGGKNTGPSEDCNSIDEWREVSPISEEMHILLKMYGAIKAYIEGKIDQEEAIENLSHLPGLLNKYRFNREDINKELQAYTNREPDYKNLIFTGWAHERDFYGKSKRLNSFLTCLSGSKLPDKADTSFDL
jgi:hypothetical protein